MKTVERTKIEKWIKENICMDSHEIREFRGDRIAELMEQYASTKAEEELEKFMTTLDIKEDRKVIRKLRRYIIQYKQQ